MNNSYEIRGDTTVIFLRKKDGSTLETEIDTYKLSKAKEFPNSWFAHTDKKSGRVYVHGNEPAKPNSGRGSKRKLICLHRFLTDAPFGYVVDHVDRNPLNNKMSNLRIVTQGENTQNARKTKTTTSSGVRGVYWHKKNNKWAAKVQIRGKSTFLGLYDDLQEAEKVVVEYRKKNMEFSNEECSN